MREPLAVVFGQMLATRCHAKLAPPFELLVQVWFFSGQ